jgi:cardiolipin synthase
VQSPLFSIPLWFVILVLLKELVLIGGAMLMFYQKGFLKVEPTWLGKATMAVQSLFIIWLFACYFFHWLPVKTYYTALGVVLILVLSSLFQYVKIGLKQAYAYLS